MYIYPHCNKVFIWDTKCPTCCRGRRQKRAEVGHVEFQKCMKETMFDMNKCQWEIDKLKECCRDHPTSLHCAFDRPRPGAVSTGETAAATEARDDGA